MEEAAIVKLDDLNPKQRLKEFKSTQKDIKSKEQATRQRALDKCKDIRYLVEGGCLFPLVNSLSTKKNAYELSKITADALLGFLQLAAKDNKDSIVAALKAILVAEGHLEVLKILADIVIYKEEVKKKKPVKVKKGEVPPEEPPVVENPLVVDLRLTTLKCVYYIVAALYADFTDDNSTLRTAFATVSNLTIHLSQIVCSCSEKLVTLAGDADIPEKVSVVQLCEYASMSLVFSLRYNRSVIPTILSTPLLASLQTLSREPFFTLYSLQLLDIISTNADEGVPALAAPQNFPLLQTLLEDSTKSLIEAAAAAAAAAAAPAKGAPKKEAPPKKGAPVVAEVVDPFEKVERIPVDTNRCSVAVTKLVTNVLIAIAVKQIDLLDLSALEPTLSLLSKLVLNTTLWQVTRDALQPPLDLPLLDTIDSVCVLFGTLGSGSVPARKSVCQAGGLTALLSVMLQSKVITTEMADPSKPAPTEEAVAFAGRRLTNLRRAAGKAVLQLITDRVMTSEEAATVPPMSTRWKSCNNFVTDAELFTTPPPTTTPPTPTVITQLVEMIAASDDVDLVNRGVRLMSALLLGLGQGASDFIASTTFDTLVTTKLSVVVQSRAQSIIDQLTKEAVDKAAAAAAAQAQKAQEEEGLESTPPEEQVGMTGSSSLPKEDFLIPNPFEAFYLSLTVLEKIFACLSSAATPEAIKAFASRERLKVMSNVLNVLGPMAWNAENRLDGPVPEYQIPLRDPRVHSWYVSVNPHDTNAAASAISVDEDSVFLRPLLFDVLAMIARSDAVYRTVEGELPPPPCVALPPTKSVTEEYALSVCRLCSEAAASVLLCKGDYTSSPTVTIRPWHKTGDGMGRADIELSVLDAALGLLLAVTSCGVLGITAAVEAVADSGFAFATTGSSSTSVHNTAGINSSMTKLVLHLQNSNMVDESTFPSLLPAGYAWKRPQFFDETFPSSEVVPTAADQILNNQALWPFVALCSALQCILADPESTRPSALLALRTVMGLTQVNTLSPHSQPVMCDVLSTVFISLGGLVHVTGLLGRFGNTNDEDKLLYNTAEFCKYLAGRGADRESFWLQYAEDNKPVEVIDPKTGKPIVKKEEKKKDDKKDAKKVDPKAAQGPPPIVTEILYNIESTYEVPDPNRGPKAALWVKILEVVVPDEHVHCAATTVLFNSIQGSLSELALQLIALGVSVNQTPESLTPLMVGFLLNDAPVVEALIAAGADCDALDSWRNSVIKFCLMSMTRDDILRYLPGHQRNPDETASQIVYGEPTQLDSFLHSKVDVNVLDSAGYSPIMIASGMGEMAVRIGGYNLCLRNVNSVFNENLNFFATNKPMYGEIKMLYDAGSSVNLCDQQGITPLHIAAARGDLTLISQLFSLGAVPNALDSFGFLHIHYAAACCPARYFIETFNLLMSNSIERPVEQMVFNDDRTGKEQAEKDSIELTAFIDSSFSEAFSPSIISKPRLHYHDLMLVLTSDQMNVLQLAMAAHVLLAEYTHIQPFLTSDKMDRMTLSLHLLKCVKDSTGGGMASLLTNVDSYGMTALHAASLLFKGVTPTRELTPAEIRSKRVKTYPSMELHLLDLIKIHTQNSAGDVCTNCYALKGIYSWTPVHAAIVNNNPDLFKTLVASKELDVCSYPFVHLMASQPPKNQIHPDIVRYVISLFAENSSAYQENLNGFANYNCTPLHMAVRNGQVAVIEALVSCIKVDLSFADPSSQTTAFFEACQIGDIDVVRRFRRGADRMDFLGSLSPEGENCIEYVVKVGYTDILKELIHMRRNDVLECVITQKVVKNTSALSMQVEPAAEAAPAPTEGVESSEAAAEVVKPPTESTESILMRLETENLQLAAALGFSIPKEFLPVEVVEVKPADEEGEEDGDVSVGAAATAATSVEAAEGGGGEDPYKILVGITVRNATGEEEPLGGEEAGAAADPLEESGALPVEATEVSAEPLQAVEEAIAAPSAAVDSLVTEFRAEQLVKFNHSNEMLRVLLDLVGGTSLVDASHHVHDMFAAGVLINEVWAD